MWWGEDHELNVSSPLLGSWSFCQRPLPGLQAYDRKKQADAADITFTLSRREIKLTCFNVLNLKNRSQSQSMEYWLLFDKGTGDCGRGQLVDRDNDGGLLRGSFHMASNSVGARVTDLECGS